MQLKGRGIKIFDNALEQGAKFLFVPVGEAGSDWAEMKPQIAARFKLAYAGKHFEIYDLRGKRSTWP